MKITHIIDLKVKAFSSDQKKEEKIQKLEPYHAKPKIQYARKEGITIFFQDENKENRIEVLELPAQTKETHGFPREKERWDCGLEISFVFLQVSSGLKEKKRPQLFVHRLLQFDSFLFSSFLVEFYFYFSFY